MALNNKFSLLEDCMNIFFSIIKQLSFPFLGQKDGHCPYVDKKHRYCYGNETSTCLFDSDCSENAKCCNDGCSSVCSDIVTKPGKYSLHTCYSR